MKNGEAKIDKGIPVPACVGGRRLSREAELMKQMKKGDSILLHKGEVNSNKFGRRYIGVGKYAIRRDGDGYRVWKVA